MTAQIMNIISPSRAKFEMAGIIDNELRRGSLDRQKKWNEEVQLYQTPFSKHLLTFEAVKKTRLQLKDMSKTYL